MTYDYGEEYLSLTEKIDSEGFVIAKYLFRTQMDPKKAASAIAGEQSTGTWTRATTLDKKIQNKYGGKVIALKVLSKDGNINTAETSIAFPIEDFSLDVGCFPQIFSVIAGNLFGLASLNSVRLQDVRFPKSIVENYPGPRFGIEGMRKLLKRPDLPLVGTIVKPKIGLTPKKTAEYIYQCGIGGLTNSKDDETLVNQRFCPLEERTSAIAEALDRVKDETGRVMIHAINISTNPVDIIEVAERAVEMGAKEIMIDVLTVGFSALASIARADLGVPIHVHRTMHGAITRNPNHGISMMAFAKMVRMAGGDALHIGSFGVGKMASKKEEELRIRNSLKEPMYGRAPVMPVASGGLYPGAVFKLVKISGLDVQIQAGGGVAGHPDGIMAGAKAMADAVEGATDGCSPWEFGEGKCDGIKRKELLRALQYWGPKKGSTE